MDDILTDGIDHINIYSKGNTHLGKMLSNFYPCKLNHPTYGYFKSVEGFYYYLQIISVADMYDIPLWFLNELDEMKKLSNYDAKKRGQELKQMFDDEMYSAVDMSKFKKEILNAIRLKIEQNEEIKQELIESTLPFDYYYVYESKVIELPQFKYIVNYIEELREEFKG